MQHFTQETLAAARARALPVEPGAGRIIFAGTPEIAATCLRELLRTGADVAAVLTRPDAPVGRRRRLTPSPVAQTAQEAGIEVIKADRMDPAAVSAIADVGADLGVVVAYGALLPPSALELPTRGWVNLHYSWLPRHRGAAPVPHTLLAGETTTAATVFQLEAGMDTGPVHGLCSFRIEEAMSAGAVLQELTTLGSGLLTVLLPDLLAGTSQPIPQQGEPSFAPKLSREDAFIDPRRPAAELVRRINATIPEPGAWTLNQDQRIKFGVARLYRPELATGSAAGTAVESVAGSAAAAARAELAGHPPGAVLPLPDDRGGSGTVIAMRAGDGSAVVLSSVQPAGRRMISVADWHRGLHADVRLGRPEETGTPETSAKNSPTGTTEEQTP